MKRILQATLVLMITASPAWAGANWHSIGLDISLADAPKVQAAMDKLNEPTQVVLRRAA